MTRRFKINVLAAAIIAAGGVALFTPPANAAARFAAGCASMQAARMQAYESCANAGGTGFASSGSCSDSGYSLSTTCYFD